MAATLVSQALPIEDQALLRRLDADYAPGVTILRRVGPAGAARKVNVYVDGLLTTIDEDALERLIEIGFYRVVTRRP